MAVDAVSSEPVSAPYSLVTGKSTGNYGGNKPGIAGLQPEKRPS